MTIEEHKIASRRRFEEYKSDARVAREKLRADTINMLGDTAKEFEIVITASNFPQVKLKAKNHQDIYVNKYDFRVGKARYTNLGDALCAAEQAHLPCKGVLGTIKHFFKSWHRALAILVVIGSIIGCASHNASCVTPPPTTTSNDQSAAIALAVQLASLPISPSITTSFSSIVDNSYEKLSDQNTTLYLLLSAIDCYSSRKDPISGEVAKELVAVVVARYSNSQVLPIVVDQPSTLPTLIWDRDAETKHKIRSLLKKLDVNWEDNIK